MSEYSVPNESDLTPVADEDIKWNVISSQDYVRDGKDCIGYRIYINTKNASNQQYKDIFENVTDILLEDGITVGGRPLKDCYEAVGHGAAYDFMLELARQQDMSITEETIKTLHKLFYQKVNADQSGQYRTIQVYISGTEYIPPSPEEVPQLMKLSL